MVGLGTWAGKTNARLIRGEIQFTIADKNGEYDIDVKLPGSLKDAKIKFYDIVEVDDKTLTGKGDISLVPGKVLTGEFKFDGDTVYGEIHGIPVIRTVKIYDGYRVK